MFDYLHLVLFYFSRLSFYVSIGFFVFVVILSLGLEFLITSQEIGWKERIQNNLFCVELDVKP